MWGTPHILKTYALKDKKIWIFVSDPPFQKLTDGQDPPVESPVGMIII